MIALLIGVLFSVPATSALGQAPIPQALVMAKRAFMVNEAGDLKRFDSLAEELRKWGRFQLVDKREDADVVIVFGKGRTQQIGSFSRAGGGYMVPVTPLAFEVRDRADNSLLWSEIGGTPARFVKHLRERLTSTSK